MNCDHCGREMRRFVYTEKGEWFCKECQKLTRDLEFIPIEPSEEDKRILEWLVEYHDEVMEFINGTKKKGLTLESENL